MTGVQTCALPILQDGERVAVYYGAADTVVGLAFGYIREILEFTKRTSIL